MDQVHFIKINGKEYPFAYSPSVMTRAHAMKGARESEFVLQFAMIYQAIKKGCKRENVKFPFQVGDDASDGVDTLTDILYEDKASGGDALKKMNEIIQAATVQYSDDEIESKKNLQQMKLNGTSSVTAASPNISNQSQEPLITIFTPGEIVT